jgi:hypothetical protein
VVLEPAAGRAVEASQAGISRLQQQQQDHRGIMGSGQQKQERKQQQQMGCGLLVG